MCISQAKPSIYILNANLQFLWHNWHQLCSLGWHNILDSLHLCHIPYLCTRWCISLQRYFILFTFFSSSCSFFFVWWKFLFDAKSEDCGVLCVKFLRACCCILLFLQFFLVLISLRIWGSGNKFFYMYGIFRVRISIKTWRELEIWWLICNHHMCMCAHRISLN